MAIIARLAVDLNFQGNGYGAALLTLLQTAAGEFLRFSDNPIKRENGVMAARAISI